MSPQLRKRIEKRAYKIWEDSGGGGLTQKETDLIWLCAEKLVDSEGEQKSTRSSYAASDFSSSLPPTLPTKNYSESMTCSNCGNELEVFGGELGCKACHSQ